MTDKIKTYRELRNKINISLTKENISDEIIKTIRTENINYPDLALELGISKEKFSDILLQPQNASGSELLLISDNINTKKLKYKK